MSQALENNDITGAFIGRGDPYQPQSTPAQEPRGMSNFVDGSGPIFSMYLDRATEEDEKMVEGWKADAEGILVFTGLFSAAVASLISVTIQDIRPNPQDTSNFYLANLYQATLADPGSNISASLPASPPLFSPPKDAVWVNTLLFMSLVISITCALLATLLQQWARRCLKVTRPRYSLHKRARIRSFFAEGVDKFLLPWAVEALPTLLHVSLFLFFAGISVFLWTLNLTIFKSVVSWIGICTALYGCITFVPIIRHDSPYDTPLSLPAWHIITGISFMTFRALQWFTAVISMVFCAPCYAFVPLSLLNFAGDAYHRFESMAESYHKSLLRGMQRTAEKTALDSSSEIDTRAFLWTFDSLDEDHELERFFSGVPGFRSSKVVDDPLPHLREEQRKKLSTALTGLFDRTFSSDLVPESVKNWRAIVCARALDPALFPDGYNDVMERIMFDSRCRGLQTSKFGCIVRGWGNGGNQDTGLITQAIVSGIVAGQQRRDDSWFILASSTLGVPESVLRDYAANGDSLSFAIWTHVVRQQFDHLSKPSWPSSGFSWVLDAAPKFNVQDTLPELQHKFCALWNQIVLKAQNDGDDVAPSIAPWILRRIRNFYVSLHQDTNSAPTRFSASTGDWEHILSEPSAYPVCSVAGHIHDNSAPTTFVRTVLDDKAAPVSISMANPDVPSSSLPHPLHVIESLDLPPLDDDTHVPQSIHPAHRAAIDYPRIPATSPNPVTAQAIQGGDDTTTTVPSSTPGALTSGAVHIRYTAERRTSSDHPDFPSSPSPTPILLLSSNFPVTRPAHTSSLESHSPIRQCLSSAPDLGVAAEGDGSVEVALHKEKDPIYPPLVIRENTISIPELPSQSHSVAIAGPSRRSLDAEHTEDLPHPSHGQYDIV
ncbi:hypothetical protein EDB85DRAFT_2294358 [Lactarius pseudohatsudake]|nr:hypothetical protein EDB85DRAFT_2294358 [Lactarius pseudohatsudake]